MTQTLDFDITTQLDEEISEIIAKEVLSKSMNVMRNEAIQQAPAHTSELRNKIKLFDVSDELIILRSLAPHSASVEYGTSPHFVPIAPLKFWAKKKLGDENIAYAVRAKIAKEGTEAKPFLRPALDITMNTHLPIILQETKAKYN